LKPEFNFWWDDVCLFYRNCQEPPSSSQNPEKSIDNISCVALDILYYEQPPPYSQLSVPSLLVKHSLWEKQKLTSMISYLRLFLVLSGVIYFLLALLAVGLSYVLITHCDISLYYSLWAICLLTGSGINMIVIVLWTSDAIIYLTLMSLSCCSFCAIGYSLVVLTDNKLSMCLSSENYLLDTDLLTNLELIFGIIFILCTLQNIISLMVTSYVRNKMSLTSTAAVK
jgi:hypothetical protein